MELALEKCDLLLKSIDNKLGIATASVCQVHIPTHLLEVSFCFAQRLLSLEGYLMSPLFLEFTAFKLFHQIFNHLSRTVLLFMHRSDSFPRFVDLLSNVYHLLREPNVFARELLKLSL